MSCYLYLDVATVQSYTCDKAKLDLRQTLLSIFWVMPVISSLICSLRWIRHLILSPLNRKMGHDVFPSIHKLSEAKQHCYPSDDNIEVTKTRSQIQLQAILDKTAERLVKSQLFPLDEKRRNHLKLVRKWDYLIVVVIALTNRNLKM